MNQFRQLSLNAIEKDSQSLYDLWSLSREDAEGAKGELFAAVDTICKAYFFPQPNDLDKMAELVIRVFDKFLNANIRSDKNAFNYLNFVYRSCAYDQFNMYSKIDFDSETDLNFSTEDTFSRKNDLQKEVIISEDELERHVSIYGDLHPLKNVLYLSERKAAYNIEYLYSFISQSSSPIMYGYYNERISSSFYNLRHNLLANFSLEEREYMDEAIRRMMQTKSEDRPNNPDPMVGACVVNSQGEILATCARGERRPEEHCEFILFDEKLKGSNLEDCTLYVTLEPCSKRGYTKEGKKKNPCADHIINSGIKRVCVGMLDPDENIFENGVQKLLEAGIDVWFFHPDLTKQIAEAEGNRKFIEHRLQKKQ